MFVTVGFLRPAVVFCWAAGTAWGVGTKKKGKKGTKITTLRWVYNNLIYRYHSFQFSFDKPKLKQSQLPVITKIDIIISQWELQVKTGNLLEVRETTSDQDGMVLVLHLIGWDGGVSFVFEQSQNKIKQDHKNPGSLTILTWKLL